MPKSIFFDDLKCVIDEAVHIHEILKHKGPKALHMYDFLSEITNPLSNQKILIGNSARKRLWQLSRKILARHDEIKGRVTEANVFRAISEQLAIFLTTDAGDFNAAAVERMVSAAVNAARATIVNKLIFYYPCIIANESERPQLKIGPVTFYQTDFFIKENEHKFSAYVNRVRESWKTDASKPSPFENLIKDKSKLLWPSLRVKREAERFAQDAIDYLNNYRWIAAIEIQGHDRERSEEIGEMCVEAALNVLRLFVGPAHAAKFRLGGRFRKEIRGASLSESDSGDIDVSYSSELEDELLGDDWIEKCLEGPAKQWVDLAGSLVEGVRSGRKLPTLYHRYIIALWWFGEGVSEPHDHAKIVRYATALEALLGTPIPKGADGRDVESLTSQLSRRAGFLCARLTGGDREKWQSEVKEFYNIRSRIVHGDYAPFDPKLARYVVLGANLSRTVLMEGLAWTLFLSHRDHMMGATIIGKYFDRVLPRCPIPTDLG